MLLIDVTFRYENVVIHIGLMRMAFPSNIDARVDIDQGTHCNAFSWCHSMSPEMT